MTFTFVSPTHATPFSSSLMCVTVTAGIAPHLFPGLVYKLTRPTSNPNGSGSLVHLDLALDLFAFDLHLAPVGVHRHVDDLGFGDLNALARAAVALGLDDDADGDGGGADARGLGVEADEVADVDRLVERDLAHGDGDEALDACAPVGLDRAGDVNVAEDDAAEDGALRVGVARQQRDAYGRVAV